MATRKFKLKAATTLTNHHGEESIRLDMTGKDGASSLTLTREKVSAAHSTGKKLHIQSGDSFIEIECRDVSQALQLARWLNGEELTDVSTAVVDVPPLHSNQDKFNRNLRRARKKDIEDFAKELVLQQISDVDHAVDLAEQFYRNVENMDNNDRHGTISHRLPNLDLDIPGWDSGVGKGPQVPPTGAING